VKYEGDLVLRPWGSPSLLYNGYRVFPGGKGRPGRDADRSPPSSAVGHERVELYLYSPYGPYGLYRASVPVQGCTLPYFLLLAKEETVLQAMTDKLKMEDAVDWECEKKKNNLEKTIHSSDYDRSKTVGECGMFHLFG